MTTKAKRKLLLIRWLDSYGPDGWHHFDTVDDTLKDCGEVISIGWLVGETPRFILIAPHLGTSIDKPDQLRGELAIPRVSIQSKRVVKL